MQPPPPPQGGQSAPLQAIFDEFEAYPFSDDPDFKAGLPTVVAAIRAKERTAAQIDEMIGRAQWFYFTRIKNLQIPWEAYAQYSQSQIRTYPTANQSGTISLSSPPGQRPGATSTARPSDPLAQLNNLAEARRMMSSFPGREGGEEGMSFAMLCRLISEGRAGEVAQAQREGEGMVVDAINSSLQQDKIIEMTLQTENMGSRTRQPHHQSQHSRHVQNPGRR
ncbi:hypothetical protein TREMEDRAFT_61696 [Tremella mesenterica DSM 1558]|uniref:uncharacterized protein n=1 Tax=Tremella mesenterica (strain ATCC 24925 / CBS 8224 / DSM 1558 / NBRC 9311 / NRRL Y-6157 / RJB 2259-6 / UBC 559-6) TaxID=578456 RepID=UPI0003F49929|nr:uncharacterized protein TREMEDRAFT_61696 [Tremella mesenterica DSM 1558]EIW69924.1 hypothetical protein TREMEDRAFT_61696 [Tremella mesenterica DSM 1558]